MSPRPWVPRLLLALAVGCGSPGPPPAELPSRPLRVVLQKFLGFAPLLIADKEGYFRAVGLDVEFVSINRTHDALPAMLTGDVDVLAGPAGASVLSAMARGQPIRAVADKGYLAADSCASMSIMVPAATAGGSNPGQRIKTLTIGRDAATRYLAAVALEANGIMLDSITTVILPDAVVAEALRKGTIDAASAGEPWQSRIKAQTPGVEWLRFERYLPDHQYSLIFFGRYLLQERPDIGARFLAAYRRGVARYNEGKTARNLALLTEATGEDSATLARACWPMMRPDSRINLPSLIRYQAWARRQGFLDAEASPEQIWDSSLVVRSDSILAHGER
ncbi:MAG: ABC transporter substrate-binding protein [Gemmatimonadales bacterium]